MEVILHSVVWWPSGALQLTHQTKMQFLSRFSMVSLSYVIRMEWWREALLALRCKNMRSEVLWSDQLRLAVMCHWWGHGFLSSVERLDWHANWNGSDDSNSMEMMCFLFGRVLFSHFSIQMRHTDTSSWKILMMIPIVWLILTKKPTLDIAQYLSFIFKLWQVSTPSRFCYRKKIQSISSVKEHLLSVTNLICLLHTFHLSFSLEKSTATTACWLTLPQAFLPKIGVEYALAH